LAEQPARAVAVGAQRLQAKLVFRTTLDEACKRLTREQAAVAKAMLELDCVMTEQRFMMRSPIHDQIVAHAHRIHCPTPRFCDVSQRLFLGLSSTVILASGDDARCRKALKTQV